MYSLLYVSLKNHSSFQSQCYMFKGNDHLIWSLLTLGMGTYSILIQSLMELTSSIKIPSRQLRSNMDEIKVDSTPIQPTLHV